MSTRVYVSADPTAEFGDTWDLVGTIESRDCKANEATLRDLRKSSSGNPRLKADFYLAGDPNSDWVQSRGQGKDFGIAFDLMGDGAVVLRAEKPARVVHLQAHPPEVHPGLLIRPVFVGIRVAGGVRRV